MENLQLFIAYANDFEKTLVDDDWTRLQQYFADDATYEVKAQSFGCLLKGRDQIFRGIKKSLDGFDRKFENRKADVTSGPDIEGEEIRIGWAVTYHKEGLPPYVLRGRSTARYHDGKISYLCDSYEPAAEEAARTWQRENGIELDPSYT